MMKDFRKWWISGKSLGMKSKVAITWNFLSAYSLFCLIYSLYSQLILFEFELLDQIFGKKKNLIFYWSTIYFWEFMFAVSIINVLSTYAFWKISLLFWKGYFENSNHHHHHHHTYKNKVLLCLLPHLKLFRNTFERLINDWQIEK